MGQRPDQPVEGLPDLGGGRDKFEPVMLRLHTRRQLNPAHRLHRGRPGPPTDIPAHRLIAPGKAKLAHQHLEEDRDRAASLPKPSLHRVHPLRPARQDTRPHAATIGGIRRPAEPVAEGRFIDLELSGNLPHGHLPSRHLLRNRYVILPQFCHGGSGR